MAFSNELDDYAGGEPWNVETAVSKVPHGSDQPESRSDGAYWLFLGVAASGIVGVAAVIMIWWGLEERGQGLVALGLILFFVVALVWGATAAVLTYRALKLLAPAVLCLLRNKDKVRLGG